MFCSKGSADPKMHYIPGTAYTGRNEYSEVTT